jgi:hypothetical protein
MSARKQRASREEWWADEIEVVLGGSEPVWYGYPLGPGDQGRLGPFKSRLEAERALSRVRTPVMPIRLRPS